MGTTLKCELVPWRDFRKIVQLVCNSWSSSANQYFILHDLLKHHERHPEAAEAEAQAQKKIENICADTEKNFPSYTGSDKNSFLVVFFLGQICGKIKGLVSNAEIELTKIPNRTLKHWVATCLLRVYADAEHGEKCECEQSYPKLHVFLWKRELAYC